MNGREAFSRIAGRYDTLNRVLSLGRDRAWRRSAADLLPPGLVLDLGAGTGAANLDLGARQVVAFDPSLPMLGRNAAHLRVAGVGEYLPFGDGCFDGAFSAYVFRNLESIPAVLREIHRVLRPGGAAAVVDLARPPTRWRRRLHRAGSAVVLPVVGAVVGARREYRYLHRSLDALPPPEELFAGGPLRLERLWRMGPLGFVYGAVLRKEG